MTTTMNGVPFRKMLVPKEKYNIKCPYTMTPKKITIHNTDNQASAENEIRYMISNNNEVSFHLAIDEKEVIQGLPFNRNGWHAGDGGKGYGNRNTIGVEMCRSYDKTRNTTDLKEPLKSQFEKTFENTIKVVAQLCVDLGIEANRENIKMHRDWSGKYCPRKILDDGTWDKLVNRIIEEYKRLKSQNVKKDEKKKEEKQTKVDTKPTTTYKVGDKIKIKSTAKYYSRTKNVTIPNRYKGNSYTIQQVGKDDVLLKELYSWVKMNDIEPVNKTTQSKQTTSKQTTSTKTSFKVGDKVTIKQNAKTYATGENIPSKYKGKPYTIQQVKSDRVLIKELYSWVRISDLIEATSTKSTPSFKVGNKVTLKSTAQRYATGELIPARYKGKKYTIQQVKNDRVLLKELYSWVFKKDID